MHTIISCTIVDNVTKEMPEKTKRILHLSEIGKVMKKCAVLTANGSVNNVSSNGGDGIALPGEYVNKMDVVDSCTSA